MVSQSSGRDGVSRRNSANHRDPQTAGDRPRPVMHRTFGPHRQIGRAMCRKQEQEEQRDADGVPIEQAHLAAHREVREERKAK
jgi:hypothetical protein